MASRKDTDAMLLKSSIKFIPSINVKLNLPQTIKENFSKIQKLQMKKAIIRNSPKRIRSLELLEMLVCG